MSDRDEEVPRFGPLKDYVSPSSPAKRTAQRLLDRVRRILHRDGDKTVEDDRLKQATHATIEGFTAFPDCSLLARELDETLGEWAAEKGVVPDHLRLVVLPPGDGRDLIETWARLHGHALLDPPERGAILSRDPVTLPSLEGEGVLVIPRLERWFLRHRHGLARVRALLAALADTERRCVIGCNSWAWSFLCRSAGADLLMPEPITFAPFDAERLRLWFSELAEADETRGVTFRDSGSATDVFARDEEGVFESDYLPGLAARSRGVPWVAWQLWRRGLRTMPDEDEASDEEETDRRSGGQSGGSGDPSGHGDVLWLVQPDGLVLPLGHERIANLVLHALLMHGTLDVEELSLVLPIVGDSNIVPALVRSGHVERSGGRYRCVSGAYPDVVESLSTAGIGMPPL